MREFGFILALACSISACGYESVDNEVTGQVKRVVHQTPLICPTRYDVDISLGVMRGGVGSMSTQDIWLTVEDPAQVSKLQDLAKSGAIANIKYSVARFVICQNPHQLDDVAPAPPQ
jgi:hypothetical protein